MRKLVILTLAVFVSAAAAVLVSQGHENATERTVKQRITLTTDTRVGSQVLNAGDYTVTCDRERIRFQSGRTVLEVPCVGPELSEAATKNEVHTSTAPDGTRILTRLLLKGSNVQHEFQ